MLTEILARLPLRSISRFKSVCKTWKSTLESAYFRRLFVSVHQKSSSSWSIMGGADELIGFHGCETLGMPKSPASFIPTSFKRYYSCDFDYADSSSGLVLIRDGFDKNAHCYVGNPVLQHLVTRVDVDGVVSSFKVFRLASLEVTNDYLSCALSSFLYSSETGIWTCKIIHCPYQISNLSNINLNGTIYFSCLSEPGVLVAHDFYSESDQFRVVQFPDHSSHNKDFKTALTTSGGFVIYVRALAQKEETFFKAWRLNNDHHESWQLLWDIRLPIIGNYAPLAIHPFDNAIAYLWCQQDHHWVSCNLRTQNCTIISCNDDHQDCFIDQSVCEKRVDEIWNPRSSSLDDTVSIWFYQFVLPRWMESVPCPPQAEMMDTTSLLSYTSSTRKTRKRQ
ncbi:hypothetical protein EUTSA_v10013759mg [Eutrema salsugineum]|uniref:Uncharacterized protein n=1 Tax=Eutrema salsugineum TaxID=72664 RepID=V4N8J2_EUTSA|nr:hypothetical protein EUTSA_v10013759mg [Eutrema salsugineum]